MRKTIIRISCIVLLIANLAMLSACGGIEGGIRAGLNNIQHQMEFNGYSNVTDVFTDEHILGVKNANNSSYSEITYGEAFDSFFTSPKWQYYRGTDQDTGDEFGVVEFTGYCLYDDVKVKALIQFVISQDGKTFDAQYLSFNDVPQNLLTLGALIDKAFSTASNETTVNSQQNESTSNNTVSSNSTNSSRTTSNTNSTNTSSPIETQPTWKKSYLSIVENMRNIYGNAVKDENYDCFYGMCGGFLVDLGNDEIPELIVAYSENGYLPESHILIYTWTGSEAILVQDYQLLAGGRSLDTYSLYQDEYSNYLKKFFEQLPIWDYGNNTYQSFDPEVSYYYLFDSEMQEGEPYYLSTDIDETVIGMHGTIRINNYNELYSLLR